MLLAGDAAVNFFPGTGQKLGSNDHVIPFREIPNGPAQILLAGAALVSNRRIKEVDPQFQPAADNLPGMLFVQSPAVLAVSGIAKSHASHAHAGHLKL